MYARIKETLMGSMGEMTVRNRDATYAVSSVDYVPLSRPEIPSLFEDSDDALASAWTCALETSEAIASMSPVEELRVIAAAKLISASLSRGLQ